MVCPDCNGTLKGAGNLYSCSECGSRWEVSFKCEVCTNTATIMSSCGSVSFFCETCKKLKSRESMNKEFNRVG